MPLCRLKQLYTHTYKWRKERNLLEYRWILRSNRINDSTATFRDTAFRLPFMQWQLASEAEEKEVVLFFFEFHPLTLYLIRHTFYTDTDWKPFVIFEIYISFELSIGVAMYVCLCISLVYVCENFEIATRYAVQIIYSVVHTLRCVLCAFISSISSLFKRREKKINNHRKMYLLATFRIERVRSFRHYSVELWTDILLIHSFILVA